MMCCSLHPSPACWANCLIRLPVVILETGFDRDRIMTVGAGLLKTEPHLHMQVYRKMADEWTIDRDGKQSCCHERQTVDFAIIGCTNTRPVTELPHVPRHPHPER